MRATNHKGKQQESAEIRNQQARDPDFALGAKRKKSKKKKTLGSDGYKQQTLKREHILRERLLIASTYTADNLIMVLHRAGYKPECVDSEDDEDNKIRYIPQLSVPNRPESRETPTCSKSWSPPVRSKRPNVSDSDSNDGEDLASRLATEEIRRWKS